MYCSSCGSEVAGSFCSNCGLVAGSSELTKAPNANPQAGEKASSDSKDKKTALLLCIFLGWLGAHHFYIGNTGTGILYLLTFGLFGIGWIVDIFKILGAKRIVSGQKIYSNSLLTADIISTIRDGDLPVLGTNNIMLSPGEICHFIDRAILLKNKNVITGYKGGSAGVSVRVMKGVSIRSGQHRGTAVRQQVTEQFSGILYLTNKRVIFSSSKGFDKALSSLTSMTPYTDGLGFQFGSSSYTLKTAYPDLATEVFRKIRK